MPNRTPPVHYESAKTATDHVGGDGGPAILNVTKLCVNLLLRPFSLHCLFRLALPPLYLITFSHKVQLVGKHSINISQICIFPTPHGAKAGWAGWPVGRL